MELSLITNQTKKFKFMEMSNVEMRLLLFPKQQGPSPQNNAGGREKNECGKKSKRRANSD